MVATVFMCTTSFCAGVLLSKFIFKLIDTLKP